MALTFEWDPRKAEASARKHGVAFDEARTVFGDPLSATVPDPDSRTADERFVTVGMSAAQRLLVVIHADRGDIIRLISAREATRAERHAYEEADSR